MLVYRQEIDGLRAIAVLAVILYHAGFTSFFAGGYVGVDIFFVISGYLVTSLINAECEEKTFSPVHFYERRCRRILPMLFFILFISSVFSYYWMLPEQLKEFGQTLISVIFLSSNIFLWWKDDSYFARLSELNPLVHTWSLAVEEQFYCIFPLLCYFFIKKKRTFTILLVCLAVFSFLLAQWGGNLQRIRHRRFYMFSQHPSTSFYLPVGRLWELLLGSFAAFYLRTDKSFRNQYHIRNQYLGFFGLVLIIVSILFFDSRHVPPFPNCYTLIPTCGATLIILYGTKYTFVGRLLSIRVLRWIGLISYSAYLWHQPLFVFIRLRFDGLPEGFYMVITISAILAVSVLTYFFVEQPFRNKKHFSQKYIFSIAGIITLITLILALFLIQTANNRNMSSSEGGDTYLSDLVKYGSANYNKQAFYKIKRLKTFSNQKSTAGRRLLLIGDSYAKDFYSIILEGKHLMTYEMRVYFVNYFCQIYIGSEDRQQFIEAQHKQTCANANDIKDALPLIKQANVIILASSWKEWSARRLPMTLKLLNLTKKQQAFVIGAKHFGSVNPILYVNKAKEYRMKQYHHPKEDVVKVNTLLKQTIDKSVFVNMLKMICTGYNQTCPLFTPDGKLISYDGSHLTKYGALYVGNKIFKNKPLNRL